MQTHDKSIAAEIAQQRAGIPSDIDRGIEDFIRNANRTLAKKLLKTFKVYGNPEEGFEVWKSFMQTGDDVALRAQIRTRKVSLFRYCGMVNQSIKDMQRQNGQWAYSPKSLLSRLLQVGVNLITGPLLLNNNRGNLDYRQTYLLGGLASLRMICEGPGAGMEPLSAALAPHLKAATGEKLLSSYAAFKKQAGRPLVDETVIRGLRDGIVKDAVEKFDRLAAQTYGPEQEAPMPAYAFSARKMPERVMFGVEIEGMTDTKERFPGNLTKLASVFQAAGLRAAAAFLPKQDRRFDEWKVTVDTSVISPLHFNGRYQDLNKLKDSPGIELVSPILCGPSSLPELMAATGILTTQRFASNESCGLHVHVSLEHTTLEQKKNLVKALHANEAALDQLVDPARRGDGNIFARSIAHTDLARVEAATTVGALVGAINPGNDRNYKFDMTGLVLPGAPPTIQYRAAGGAGYLNTVGDYVIILGNFTRQALDNPSVRLGDVIAELVAQKEALKKEAAAALPPPLFRRTAAPRL